MPRVDLSTTQKSQLQRLMSSSAVLLKHDSDTRPGLRLLAKLTGLPHPVSPASVPHPSTPDSTRIPVRRGSSLSTSKKHRADSDDDSVEASAFHTPAPSSTRRRSLSVSRGGQSKDGATAGAAARCWGLLSLAFMRRHLLLPFLLLPPHSLLPPVPLSRLRSHTRAGRRSKPVDEPLV